MRNPFAITNYKNYVQFNILLFYTGFVKIILEVFGASGAVWGFAEVLTLRNEDTVEFWRWICLIVALLFFIRYLVVMYLFTVDTIKKIDNREREGLPG